MKNEKLGKRATDIVSGFTGIIIGKCEYLYGCNQYGIHPGLIENGKLGTIEWFDEGRIRIIDDGINPKDVRAENSHPNIS